MKISNNPNIQQINALNAYNKNISKVKKSEAIMPASDKIEISSKAKDIQIATKAFDELPEVRQAKIDELKRLIQSGEYKPSSEDIAKKMLGRE